MTAIAVLAVIVLTGTGGAAISDAVTERMTARARYRTAAVGVIALGLAYLLTRALLAG